MTSYRYLGYGTTDANGVAHLKKNASSQDVDGYVGTGAGEVDVIASLDNPISQGSIVSGTYPVLDTKFYDKGLSGTGEHNDDWSYTRMSAERTSEGTVLTPSGAWAYAYVTSSSTYFNCPFVVEFTVVALSDSPQFRVANPSNTQNAFGLNWLGDYRFEFRTDSVIVKVNGETKTNSFTLDRTNGLNLFFTLDTTTDRVTYKDFKVYPI